MSRLRFPARAVGVVFGALCAIGASSSAHSAIVFLVNQDGADVVVQGSGSANLAGLTFGGSGVASTGGLNASLPALLVGPSVSTPADRYFGLTGSGVFGPGLNSGAFAIASSGSGQRFGISFDSVNLVLLVPDDYISGSPLSGQLRFTGRTLASLGVTPGASASWTWGSGNQADSMTLQVGTVPGVPAPATLALTGLALAALALQRRLRAG